MAEMRNPLKNYGSKPQREDTTRETLAYMGGQYQIGAWAISV